MACKIRAAMKKLNFLLATLLVLQGLSFNAHAEKADRNKPMNIEADSLVADDLKQVTIAKGRVVVSKGTILIRGAQLTFREDAQGYQFGTVTAEPGQLASFRQKREGVDEYFEGEADTITYDGRGDTVRFAGHAQVRRFRGTALADETVGAVIVFDNLKGTFSVEGRTGAVAGKPSTDRVRASMVPKPEAPASAPVVSAPGVVTPALRVTPALGQVKK